MYFFQFAITTSPEKIVIHRLPWRKIFRQHSPLTTTSHYIPYCINNCSDIVLSWPPYLSLCNMWLQNFPFLITYITWIQFSLLFFTYTIIFFSSSFLRHTLRQLDVKPILVLHIKLILSM